MNVALSDAERSAATSAAPPPATQYSIAVAITLDNVPGVLGRLATNVGDAGGNIIQVAHHRTTLDAPAKGVEFDIEIETRDAHHTQSIVSALTAAGYTPRCL